jgi:hypothetical protein
VAGETERCHSPEDQGVVRVGGATRWETVGHGLPRRLPAERQPDVGPFAVFYPGMTQRLDLSSYQAVSGSSAIVLEIIGLPIEDPTHMPVTRELSANRRAMIQSWIKNGCKEVGRDA